MLSSFAPPDFSRAIFFNEEEVPVEVLPSHHPFNLLRRGKTLRQELAKVLMLKFGRHLVKIYIYILYIYTYVILCVYIYIYNVYVCVCNDVFMYDCLCVCLSVRQSVSLYLCLFDFVRNLLYTIHLAFRENGPCPILSSKGASKACSESFELPSLPPSP